MPTGPVTGVYLMLYKDSTGGGLCKVDFHSKVVFKVVNNRKQPHLVLVNKLE
jgi:hypothetical protein